MGGCFGRQSLSVGGRERVGRLVRPPEVGTDWWRHSATRVPFTSVWRVIGRGDQGGGQTTPLFGDLWRSLHRAASICDGAAKPATDRRVVSATLQLFADSTIRFYVYALRKIKTRFSIAGVRLT